MSSEPDPLAVRCAACLAPPGEDCIATSSDLPRELTHRLRPFAAAATLRRCPACEGRGWARSAGGPSTPDVVTCPVCEAAPFAACTEAGEERTVPHVVRVRAAELGVTRCRDCDAVGWIPGEPAEGAPPKEGEEPGVPVDWEGVVRQRERELKQVGEARHQAEAAVQQALAALATWKASRKDSDDLSELIDGLRNALDRPKEPTP